MKVLLIAAAMVFSTSAFAATKFVSCENADGTDSVSVYQNTDGSKFAYLKTESSGGATPSFKYHVKSILSKKMGAPVLIVGSQFRLTIKTDTAPVKGKIRSTLTAKSLGINESVLCSFN